MIELATEESESKKRQLKENMRALSARVDKLMACLFVSYNLDAPAKTIFATVYFKNKNTDDKFVVATGSSHVYYDELVDIPRGEASAYKKALEAARTFLMNVVLMQHFINSSDSKEQVFTLLDESEIRNILKNPELLND